MQYRWLGVSLDYRRACGDVERLGAQPVSETLPDLTAEQKQEIDFDGLKRIGRGEGG